MKIISNFKDYYDYAGFSDGGTQDADYKQRTYFRKPELVLAEAEALELPHLGFYPSDRIFSRWWKQNRQALNLTDFAERLGAACLFICGKAYPFLFLRGSSKSTQIIHSKIFNDAIVGSYEKELKKEQRQPDPRNEEDFNFFKPYYSFEEFEKAVYIEQQIWRSPRYRRLNQDDYKKTVQFFEFYKNKDFASLHLRLNCPIILTLFVCKRSRGLARELREFEFLCNPNLQEFGFIRIMPAELLYQEIDMYLGNILVNDPMPICFQTDLEKIAAHGFDIKTSFRKPKSL